PIVFGRANRFVLLLPELLRSRRTGPWTETLFSVTIWATVSAAGVRYRRSKDYGQFRTRMQ
uniref:Uncharacterized protein n=1 Tax=Anopheles minimus TaxID=112268 RepID=A0A182WMI8_9DIPT